MIAIADAIGVSKEALTSKLHQGTQAATRPLKRSKHAPQPIDRKLVEDVKAQDHFLALMLLQPRVREDLMLMTPDMFLRAEAKRLLEFLKAHPDFDGNADKAKALSPIAEYVRIISLQYEELYQGLELTELQYEAARLQARLVEQFVKNTKQKVAATLNDADEATMRTLLLEVKQLDALLNQVKSK